jgi:hypothetical protein
MGDLQPYILPNQSQMGRACSMHGGKLTGCGVSVGKPEGKRQLGRPIYRWEDNVVTYTPIAG